MTAQGEKSVHSGHKERLRKRFISGGCNFEGFSDYEILEFLLSYVIIRQDTNALAKRLIEQFGGLEDVFSADIGRLTHISGVGERTGVFLKAQEAVLRRYAGHVKQDKQKENDMEGFLRFVDRLFSGKTIEEFYCIMYDNNKKRIGCKMLCSGDASAVRVDTKETVRLILENQATKVIFAHNHPGGTAMASQEDWEVTKNMEQLLMCLDVELADHMIAAGNTIVSMKKNRKYIMDDSGSWIEK